MKKSRTLLILIIIFSVVGASWGERVVDKDSVKLIDHNGLVYEEGSDTPFTGKIVAHWPNGQKKSEIEYVDGKRQGKEFTWIEDGQKLYEGENFSGQSYGKVRAWHENGQQAIEVELRNSKPNGKWIEWHENGKKKMEKELRNGQVISTKCWDENGKLKPCED